MPLKHKNALKVRPLAHRKVNTIMLK